MTITWKSPEVPTPSMQPLQMHSFPLLCPWVLLPTKDADLSHVYIIYKHCTHPNPTTGVGVTSRKQVFVFFRKKSYYKQFVLNSLVFSFRFCFLEPIITHEIDDLWFLQPCSEQNLLCLKKVKCMTRKTAPFLHHANS